MICYFAYGSNMLPARLQRRCASARFSCVATLPRHHVSYSKISADGSGKATIVSSTDAAATAYGVVFHLAHEDMPILDGFEGRGKGYERLENVTVFALGDRQPMTVTTYIAEPHHIDERLQPFNWYLALVLAGARHTGLPDDYLQKLAATSAIGDPNPNRKTRQEALAILAEIGG